MEKLLDSIMDIGEQMLISGAEVHKVEDSIKRIFSAYGTKRTDVFIITSSIVVTIHIDDKAYTQTRRITEISTDYEKLHKLNQLSRSICKNKYSDIEIKKQLAEITNSKKYPLWLEFLCYAIIAGAFTLFFDGKITEAAVSFIIGALVRFVILLCDKTVKNKIFSKFVSAFFATSLAYIALRLSFISAVDKVIIGNIMTLIPGIGLTTALKDLLVGDSIAGLLRTIEACITALAIAAGYFAVAFLTGGII
ncbi:MAG: threonine/serine exporter family protein [Oscillospiraceae bacterium]|nr:threonine/serine exporter family protein [Oscillospiraceae bacterium]